MEKQERASYMRELINLYRKQGMSANKARELAGEAMRVMAQGQQWQDKAQRKADKLENYMSKAIVETIEGIDVLTLPPKNTRRTYKNGCRIASDAKTAANRLVFDICTKGKGRSLATYKGQITDDNAAMTVRICASNVMQERHLRNCKLVLARRYAKRQALRATLYAMRTTPEHAAMVWQVSEHVSVDYDAVLYNVALARNAAYNASLSCAVPYNHAAFIALMSPKIDYVKRLLVKVMLYAMRTTPEHTVWQVNASLSCAVPYNHAAFMALNTPEKD